MNKSKKRLIIVALLCGILLISFIYLFNTGYIYIMDRTPETTREITENKEEINFNDIIKGKWDFAIIVTNQNEEKVIKSYQDKGLISNEFNYYGLAPGFQQLSNIIFICEGKNTNYIIYDNRYYRIETKEEGIFYSNDCNFKVEKGIFRTTLKQQ